MSAERHVRIRGGGAFARLCEITERHGLVVEIVENPQGDRAIWVLPREDRDFEIGDVQATIRVAVVATPFMADLPYDAVSPQLISMLAERGYGEDRHGLEECERNLKAMPNYNVFTGTPAVFVCECGRRFEYADSEADGAWWELVA